VWNCGLLVWRRAVRQTRHQIPTDRNWKRKSRGMCQFVLADGIRGVRLAICKATLTEQRSAVPIRTDLSSLWRSAADSSQCSCRGNIYFRWWRLSCTCYIPSVISSTISASSHSLKCRLQQVLFIVCLSTLSGNYFSGKDWLLFFLYPRTKGTPLGSVI
jgi:hypothetical protein